MLAAAVRDAYIDEFIRSLPDGDDTVVGERGHRLSGGEKQGVAIARVILMDPRIVIDDAASHVDTLSKQVVQAALHELFNNRTSLVIAHRFATVLAPDQTLVMNHERAVVGGTDNGLVEQDGLYATLYERQFRATADPDDLTEIGVELTR